LSHKSHGEDDESVKRAHRVIANASWVIAAVAIIGFLKRPDLAPVWAFMFFFAVATTPRWLRARSDMSGPGAAQAAEETAAFGYSRVQAMRPA
jgi:hypothetical protein